VAIIVAVVARTPSFADSSFLSAICRACRTSLQWVAAADTARQNCIRAFDALSYILPVNALVVGWTPACGLQPIVIALECENTIFGINSGKLQPIRILDQILQACTDSWGDNVQEFWVRSAQRAQNWDSDVSPCVFSNSSLFLGPSFSGSAFSAPQAGETDKEQ